MLTDLPFDLPGVLGGGESLEVLFGGLGPRAAMTYQHATSERDQRIAERLAEMVDEERRRVGPVEAVPPAGE